MENHTANKPTLQSGLETPLHRISPSRLDVNQLRQLARTDRDREKNIKQHSLFVAVGLEAGEPGHSRVAETVQSLGAYTPYHESLWRVNSPHDLDKAFKQINTSMIDRRIDGTAGLLMIDPNEHHVKWHLRRPFSDMLKGCWHLRNNLFIAFTLQNPAANYERVVRDVLTLGVSAPIGKSIWYSSSTYASKEAFRILISSMDVGDELVVFDERGNVALWHDGHNQATQAYRQQVDNQHIFDRQMAA